MRHYLKLLLVSATVGALVGGAALYIGFHHNPQSEFFDPNTGAVDFGYSFLIFVSWFLVVSFAVALLGAAWMWFVRLLRLGPRRKD